MKILNLTATATLSVILLTACQGQNPFKRESNPVRNYPRVSESIRTKTGLVPHGRNQEPPKPPPDNTQIICSVPFTVTVDGNIGSQTLQFSEDSEKKYEINIINKLGDEFEAKVSSGLPAGATFRLLRKVSANSSLYQLAWNPRRIPPGRGAIINNLKIELTSPALTSRCAGVANIYFDLIALRSGARPTLSVSGLPQTPIQFGEEAAFSVEVDDPAGNGQAPILNDPSFRQEAVSGERTVLNGVSAVDCVKIAEPVPSTSKWKFTCKFLSAALTNVNSLLNSSKVAQATFFLSAKSKGNEVVSNSQQVNIKVKFERVQPGADVPAATPGAR